MDFYKFQDIELIQLYGKLLQELKKRNIIRSKNFTGDLGEFLAIDYYNKTKGLPKLQFAPPSTRNIDAISILGDRYSIKSTTTNTTGAFYGLDKDFPNTTRPLFEYVIIVKFDELYQPELILELDWDNFCKHKHWHSRVNAYNLLLTKALIQDSKILYQK